MQEEHTQINEAAWNQMAYEAWLSRFGTPEAAAKKIILDPLGRLGTLAEYMKDVSGKKVINLLGSHGSKAIALSLLGADVTVVDFSYENSRFALDVARAAKTKIRYIVSDVLHMPLDVFLEGYDIVFSELGILHYFTDLNPFFSVAEKLLKPGGRFIIEDFHPISTKLITSKGKKHKVTGDYFDTSITETDVAYLKFVPGIEELTEDEKNAFKKAQLRKWTLGEIVTAIANQGLFIKLLDEGENNQPDDKGIPKLFTIVAEKL
jgi:SAM-dependent methyltransferase